MRDIPFEEKVAKLRAAHRSSAPDAVAQVASWDEKFARLKAQQEWLGHPNTRELCQIAVEQIEAINEILATNEELGELDRKKYFALKEAHQVYLSALSVDPTSEMASIERSVDDELTDLP